MSKRWVWFNHLTPTLRLPTPPARDGGVSPASGSFEPVISRCAAELPGPKSANPPLATPAITVFLEHKRRSHRRLSFGRKSFSKGTPCSIEASFYCSMFAWNALKQHRRSHARGVPHR